MTREDAVWANKIYRDLNTVNRYVLSDYRR